MSDTFSRCSKIDMNGEPRSPSSIPAISTRSAGANEVLRSKNRRRDDQIRKKVEQELTKRPRTAVGHTSFRNDRQSSKNTVSSLQPNPAIILVETAKIYQASQLMAAKRTDAVLAVSENGELVGILTDKDIAFRVVAQQLDVRNTTVKDVMTANPMTVYDKGSRNEALNIMISRRFRHLPVIRDEFEDGATSVVGLLDITKCVFERLDDLEKKVNEDASIINAMEVLERRGNMHSDRVVTLRNEHECPDIASVMKKNESSDGENSFPSVSVKASVREAAQVMKNFHSTAVLVCGTPDGPDKVAGIFTTKDIVLRVIAASLDPNVTSVVRVMVFFLLNQTPHPDFVPPTATILDALKKLHGMLF
jgi:CBS domain-containing protein